MFRSVETEGRVPTRTFYFGTAFWERRERTLSESCFKTFSKNDLSENQIDILRKGGDLVKDMCQVFSKMIIILYLHSLK